MCYTNNVSRINEVNKMKVTIDIDTFDELYKNSWSGALDTLDDIKNAGKEEELMQHLEESFMYIDGDIPSETDLNDYLWHERELVYEAVGLNENGELPEEDEDEE